MSTTLEILEAEVLKLAPADCSHLLERLIEHINSHEGGRWSTFDEIADDFALQ